MNCKILLQVCFVRYLNFFLLLFLERGGRGWGSWGREGPVYVKCDCNECLNNNNPESRPHTPQFTWETLCAAPDKMDPNPKWLWMVHLQALPHAVFHFTFAFPFSVFWNQYYQHPSGKAVQLQKGSGNTFTPYQLFFQTAVKEDMRKFSTDTICCNQLKFNLQIVQTHLI